MRWQLPDRVFFACGACHILAHAFLQRHGRPDHEVFWIKPRAPHDGNHIFVAGGDWAFDYHGYCERAVYLSHFWMRARRLRAGWNAELVRLPRDVLIDERRSREIPGLWLREPGQFLHDALPRAYRFLDRFGAFCAREASDLDAIP